MRFDTRANRERHGVPTFATFSPDEGHNLMMVRMSRVRRKDPTLGEGKDTTSARYCGKGDLSGEEILGVPGQELISGAPTYEERRQLMAKGPLAAADGLRTSVTLVYQHLFDMRVCPFCPGCDIGQYVLLCQDLFGSNAGPEGGAFWDGRIDASHTSIEAQRSVGSLHARSQLLVQCLHQHTPFDSCVGIHTITAKCCCRPIPQVRLALPQPLCSFRLERIDLAAGPSTSRPLSSLRSSSVRDHVVVPVHVGVDTGSATRASAEAATPLPQEPPHEAALAEGRAWLQEYTAVDVQGVQQLKQLTHCRR